jgi:ketosteroid isomerase-like protein
MNSPSVHPNVLRYRRMLDSFNRNDLDRVTEVVDPDVLYTIPGKSVLAGRTRGLPAHMAMLRRAKDLSGGTLRLEPSAVVGGDEHVFVFGQISATRNGKTLRGDHCVVFRFDATRIVEGWTFPGDLYAFDAFWE